MPISPLGGASRPVTPSKRLGVRGFFLPSVHFAWTDRQVSEGNGRSAPPRVRSSAPVAENPNLCGLPPAGMPCQPVRRRDTAMDTAGRASRLGAGRLSVAVQAIRAAGQITQLKQFPAGFGPARLPDGRCVTPDPSKPKGPHIRRCGAARGINWSQVRILDTAVESPGV
jgi:hypothetical protein